MKALISTLLLVSTLSLFSQNGKVFFETNYNYFSHKSLSNFQEEFKNDIQEIPIQITDDFPGNIGFTIGYELVDEHIIIFVSHNKTGGKLSYSDFSGLIKITQNLNAYTLGGEYLIPFSKTNDNFRLGLRGFGMFSTMELESYTEILENVTKENIDFQSVNLGIGTRILYEYPLSFFILRVSLGFDLTFGGSLKFQENSEFNLEDNDGDKVKTNWTGLRTSIGIAIPIK